MTVKLLFEGAFEVTSKVHHVCVHLMCVVPMNLPVVWSAAVLVVVMVAVGIVFLGVTWGVSC